MWPLEHTAPIGCLDEGDSLLVSTNMLYSFGGTFAKIVADGSEKLGPTVGSPTGTYYCWYATGNVDVSLDPIIRTKRRSGPNLSVIS
jgi:hypothetical protein